MIPLEFAEWEVNTRSALYLKYASGFFPKPDIDLIVVKLRKDEKEKNNKFVRRMFNKLSGKKNVEELPAITDEERNKKFRKHIESKVS